MAKTNQKEFRVEKVIKRKGGGLYVKSKGYNNSFNSWINKNPTGVDISKFAKKIDLAT